MIGAKNQVADEFTCHFPSRLPSGDNKSIRLAAACIQPRKYWRPRASEGQDN